MSRWWLVALVAFGVMLIAGQCPAAGVGDKAPAFKLMDQFEKVWQLDGLKGKVVVIVGANRDSGQMMAPWIDGLKAKYGGKIQLLGLMELKGIPGFARGMARSRIKKETQDPLMVDFGGAIGKAYGVSGKYPVVYVVDRNGIIRAFQKTYTQEAGKAVNEAIEKELAAQH